jgi:peptidyl-tRNA hydrolase
MDVRRKWREAGIIAVRRDLEMVRATTIQYTLHMYTCMKLLKNKLNKYFLKGLSEWLKMWLHGRVFAHNRDRTVWRK